MADGRRQMPDGRCRMADAGWQMPDGRCYVLCAICHLPFAMPYLPYARWQESPRNARPWRVSSVICHLPLVICHPGPYKLDVRFVSPPPVPIVTGQGLTTPDRVRDLRN